MGFLEVVKRYKSAYKNYLYVMFILKIQAKNIDAVVKGMAKSSTLPKINVVLKDGSKESLTPFLVWVGSVINTYNKTPNYTIRNIINDLKNDCFIWRNQKIILHGLETNGTIDEIYFEDCYKFLNVKDEIVIDIGANIADSSIYFALQGAKKVIALEPALYPYKFAQKNIIANNLQNIIELLNAGYGIDKKIYVDKKKETGTGYILKETTSGKQIDIYSLSTLINRYNISSAILKMDCEGCEYNLLTEDDNVLKTFKKIQIEYHYGYKNLKEKLEKCGFNVKYTEPVKMYDKYAKNHPMKIGFIYAEIKSTSKVDL